MHFVVSPILRQPSSGHHNEFPVPFPDRCMLGSIIRWHGGDIGGGGKKSVRLEVSFLATSVLAGGLVLWFCSFWAYLFSGDPKGLWFPFKTDPETGGTTPKGTTRFWGAEEANRFQRSD